MLARYFIFAIIVVAAIIIAMAFVKDTGDERRKVEKKLRAENELKLRESQQVWREGPKRRK